MATHTQVRIGPLGRLGQNRRQGPPSYPSLHLVVARACFSEAGGHKDGNNEASPIVPSLYRWWRHGSLPQSFVMAALSSGDVVTGFSNPMARSSFARSGCPPFPVYFRKKNIYTMNNGYK
jgi:hypothetical protein